MRVFNIYSASGATIAWTADRDVILAGWKSFSTWVFTFDNSISYAGINARLGSGVLGDGIDENTYFIIQNNETVLTSNIFIREGQKIFLQAAGGGSSLLVLFLAEIGEFFQLNLSGK